MVVEIYRQYVLDLDVLLCGRYIVEATPIVLEPQHELGACLQISSALSTPLTSRFSMLFSFSLRYAMNWSRRLR